MTRHSYYHSGKNSFCLGVTCQVARSGCGGGRLALGFLVYSNEKARKKEAGYLGTVPYKPRAPLGGAEENSYSKGRLALCYS